MFDLISMFWSTLWSFRRLRFLIFSLLGVLFCYGVGETIAVVDWMPGLLRRVCLIVLICIFVSFLEWLMPGSTTLNMTPEERRAAWRTVLDARTYTVHLIIMVIVAGACIGVLCLPFPMELRSFMVGGLLCLYLFWFAWYFWMKRGKLPLNYYEQEKKSTIRSRLNQPARRSSTKRPVHSQHKSNIRSRRNMAK
jgi:hypothetical protein